MRETAKAKQAFNDYVAMGPGRSLEKLLNIYRNQPNPPTRHLPTLKNWSRWHNWQARLEAMAEAERSAILAKGIADRQNRVAALNERWQLLRALISARAADLKDEAPGGDTGLLVREPMLVKVYAASDLDDDSAELLPTKESRIVYKYALDTGLLKELREHEKQAAQELGQWSEGKTDAVLKYIDLARLTTEQLERIANGDDPLKVLLGS